MNNTVMDSQFGGRTLCDTTVCQRKDNTDSLFEISPKHLINFTKKENETGLKVSSGHFKAITSEAGLVVTIENELLIYDKELESPSRTVPFDSPIDFVVWRGSLLLIGTSASDIIHLCPSTYAVKENVCVRPNQLTLKGNFFVNGFIHSNLNPKYIDMVAVGIDGTLYHYDNVPLAVGSLDVTTHDANNISLEIDFGGVRGVITKRSLETENLCKINYVDSPTRDMMFTSDESGRISLFELEKSYNKDGIYVVECVADILTECGMSADVKVTRMEDCEGYLFVLLSNGKLAILYDEQLVLTRYLCLPSSSYIVHDFAVVSSRMGVKLWTIYGLPGGESDETYIGIFSDLNFTIEFSLKIVTIYEEGFTEKNCPRSYMFPSANSTFEEPFAFLEVYSNCCRIYKMAETSTDATVQKLLTKGRFDEAEILTRQYGKDMDIVYKAKVRARVLEIFSKKETSSAEDLNAIFKNVLLTLTEIRDAEFVCTFCLEYRLPRVDWFKNMLDTGMRRAMECNDTMAAKKLLLTRKKFYTFEQVLSTGTIEEWDNFNSDQDTMYLRSLWFLQNFEFQKCEKVWRRHSDEFMESINLMSFVPFFIALFSKVLATEESVSLFRVVFVDAIEKCIKEEEINVKTEGVVTEVPQQGSDESNMGLNGMVQLVSKQILSLERELDWPKGALFFMSNLINTVSETEARYEKASGNVDAQLPRKKIICAAILVHLKRLFQVLNELAELKASHSIRIAFTDYTRDSRYDVVNAMLNELFIQEEIERFISKFLLPFAKRQNLSLDKLFQSHISAVMLDLPYFISSTDIPYQERIVTLISYISSPIIQLECVLLIAKEWPVPWSAIIDNMVIKTLQMKVDDTEGSDIQKRIKILKDQVPFRCLLIKHRLTAAKVRQSDGLHMALRRILRHKKSNFMEDCLELIRHSNIFSEEDVLVMKFMLTLEDNEGKVEENIPSGSTSVLKQILYRLQQQFRCMDPNGVSGFPPNLYLSNEDWERFTLATQLAASKLNDLPTLEFLKLRNIMPNLWEVDKPFKRDYPFCLLANYLPEHGGKMTHEIISDCQELSDITFHHSNDFLAAAAVYFQGGKDISVEKWWGIITTIVKTPDLLRSHVAEKAVMNVASLLIRQCPDCTDEQMEIMHAFFVLLVESFDSAVEPIAKLFGIHRVFSTLREQEIPLENEFLYIYDCYCVEGADDFDEFVDKLKDFSITLLKFGEIDLFNSVFSNINKEYLYQAMKLGHSGDQELKAIYTDARESVKQIQWDLLQTRGQYDKEESNSVIDGLLKDLEIAGVTLNAYALKRRNKKRLLDKLIEQKDHVLASQIALVFNFKDNDTWSKILQGFLSVHDSSKLRTVLESLKIVPELWMLPQFATAWKTVSVEDPDFRDMCPIPLD